MTSLTSRNGDLFQEIHCLVLACLEGGATDSQFELLDELIQNNAAARRLYMQYLCDSMCLRCIAKSPAEEDEFEAAEMDDDRVDASILPSRQSALPVGLPLASVPSSQIGYFSASWPMAYLISAILIGLGALAASFFHITPSETQLTNYSPYTLTPSPLPNPQSPIPNPSFVARVTGMVDSDFLDPQTQTFTGAYVSLGRKYALASGLLEITYNSGAKVILQGPCSYEVTSASAGHLSIGKLTARVDKKGERGEGRGESTNNLKSEIRNLKSPTTNPQIPNPQTQISLAPSPSSPIPSSPLSPLPSPLFSIQTPTATVTDLGTEFGVEVSKEGLTQVHVLQGFVEAQGIGRNGRPRRLTEGNAIEIGREDKQIKAVTFAPQSFARALRPAATDAPAEEAYIKAVLADKPIGYWPLNEPANSRRFFDRSGNRIHGNAIHKVASGQPGPLSSDSQAVELNGNGYIDLGFHPEFAMPNDFTVEAWVWIGKLKWHGIIFSAHGVGETPRAWSFGAGGTDWNSEIERPIVLYFNTEQVKEYAFNLSEGVPGRERWLHVAVVFDVANVAHLYLDGKPSGLIVGEKPALLGPMWLTIGCGEPFGPSESIDAARWRGRIAHVAVYPRSLTAEQIKNHFNQRRDGGKEAIDKRS